MTEKLKPLQIAGPVSEVISAIAGLGFTFTMIVNKDAAQPLDKVGKTVYVTDCVALDVFVNNCPTVPCKAFTLLAPVILLLLVTVHV
jgi:hypothetical protein